MEEWRLMCAWWAAEVVEVQGSESAGGMLSLSKRESPEGTFAQQRRVASEQSVSIVQSSDTIRFGHPFHV